MTIKHLINGQEVEPFINSEELVLIFDLEEKTADIDRSDVEFYGRTKELIENFATNSPYIALKYEIVLEDLGFELKVGRYIDTTTISRNRDSNIISVQFLPQFDINWALERTKGVMLTNKNLYSSVPYVISALPRGPEAFLVFFALTYITIEMYNYTQEVAEKVSQVGSVIDAVGGILGLIFMILRFLFFIAQIIILILQIFKLIIQRVKYKKYIYAQEMLQAGFSQVGFPNVKGVFETELKNLAIVCRSFFNPETSEDVFGFTNPNDLAQDDILDQPLNFYIEDLANLYNLRFEFDEDSQTVNIVKDTFPTSANFVVKDYADCDVNNNLDTLASNYLIEFQTDLNDKNTIDRYLGTKFQRVVSFISAPTPLQMQLLKGFTRVTSNLARAIDKIKLTIPERIFSTFLKAFQPIINGFFIAVDGVITAVNAVTKQLNRILRFLRLKFRIPEINKPDRPNIANLIENRIGMMILENDLLTVEKYADIRRKTNSKDTKVVLVEGGITDAEYIFNSFHKEKGDFNEAFREIFNYNKVQMTLQDIDNVLKDEAVISHTGELGEVTKMEYNVLTRTSELRVEVKNSQNKPNFGQLQITNIKPK